MNDSVPGGGDDAGADREVLHEKLLDAQAPGALIEFDPHEADSVGAFVEDALSEQDALASTQDGVGPGEDGEVGDGSDGVSRARKG